MHGQASVSPVWGLTPISPKNAHIGAGPNSILHRAGVVEGIMVTEHVSTVKGHEVREAEVNPGVIGLVFGGLTKTKMRMKRN